MLPFFFAEVKQMEIQLSLKKGIVPKELYDNGPETFLVDYREDKQDCIEETKRVSSSGGKFKQYTLHLTDAGNEPRTVRYLFENDLRSLVQAWGKDTTKWYSKKVKISGVKDGNYMNPKLEAVN